MSEQQHSITVKQYLTGDGFADRMDPEYEWSCTCGAGDIVATRFSTKAREAGEKHLAEAYAPKSARLAQFVRARLVEWRSDAVKRGLSERAFRWSSSVQSIVDEHHRRISRATPTDPTEAGIVAGLELSLRAYAAIWRDHPDYHEEWAV